LNIHTHKPRPQAHTGAVQYDEDGFIINPDQWTETLATILAAEMGIQPLSPTHWSILHFIRDHYLSLGGIPPMRTVCRKLGTERETVKALFGSCLTVWRIAGLPNPGEEAKSYMA